MKGISLITEDADNWKIYMPFEGCHTVNIKRNSEPGVDLNQAKREVFITVKGIEPLPVKDSTFERFVNITGIHAHSAGVTLRRDLHERTTLISVAGGVYSAALSTGTFRLENRRGGMIKPLGQIGTVGTILLTAEDICVSSKGDPEISWNLDNGEEITIDNDCHQIKPDGIDGKDNNRDFHMLYDSVIVDSTGKEFIIENEIGSPSLPCNQYFADKLN
jgi:hypothetical protein